MSDYDKDIAAWATEQAAALRARAGGNALDYDNLAEEIEALARSDRREIHSRLKIILVHLLKLAYQPEQAGPGWRGSVREARDAIEGILEESPSLKPYPGERLARAYAQARIAALDQTGLSELPDACPWTIEEVLKPEFLP